MEPSLFRLPLEHRITQLDAQQPFHLRETRRGRQTASFWSKRLLAAAEIGWGVPAPHLAPPWTGTVSGIRAACTTPCCFWVQPAAGLPCASPPPPPQLSQRLAHGLGFRGHGNSNGCGTAGSSGASQSPNCLAGRHAFSTSSSPATHPLLPQTGFRSHFTVC